MSDCDNIFDRIQYIIDKEGLNISSFSKKIDVVDQTIRNIIKYRKSYPGYEVISKIIQTFPWIDAKWLLTGIQSLDCSEIKSENDLIHSQQETIKNLSETIKNLTSK